MTQLLLIAPDERDSAAPRPCRELASSLQRLGHRPTLLVPRSTTPRAALRRTAREAAPETSETAENSIPTRVLDLPPLSRALPGLFDAALYRMLPRAVQGMGIQRPEVIVITALDASAILARALSVRYGIPYLLVLGDSPQRDESSGGGGDRFEQLLAQSVQDAAVVAAPSPDLAERLRRRFTLPAVQVLPGMSEVERGAAVSALCEQVLRIARGRRMVFHAPYPLDPAPTSASRQRPNKMLAAFAENGHQVHRITGAPFQRALAYRDVRRRVAAGQLLDFLYSENSTQPNVLASSLKRGVAPLLEARILWYCDRQDIPFGQFYRDVYWRFAEQQATVPQPRLLLMQLAYRADLLALRFSRAHLFLPSLPMAPIVPFAANRSSALPPGAPVHDSPSPQGLELLYVGGVGSGYALDEGLRALQQVEQATLTMVVRPDEWAAHRERYEPLLSDRVSVVHAGSDELQEIYDRASACLLLVAPDGYRRFAVPLKLYEYLGYGKPTLASQGTLAGDLVDEMGTGFTVPNSAEEIAALLQRLAAEPSLLEGAAQRARAARLQHTWAMRARTVADVLTGRQAA